MMNELLRSLADFRKRLKNNAAVNVNSKATKNAAIELASFYFQNVRPSAHPFLNDDTLNEYDAEWQQLVSLAHGNNPKKRYQRVLARLTKISKELSIASHSAPSELLEVREVEYSKAESVLTETLENLVPSAAASYRQGIRDLNDASERLSYRGTAFEFREAMRETLDYLAPDEEVKGQSGFKLERDRTTPTMKQKVRFVLSSRGLNKTQRKASEKTVLLVETLCGDILRAVYGRASLAGHLEASRDEVHQLKRYMDALLFDLLEIK
jgi:DNA primase